MQVLLRLTHNNRLHAASLLATWLSACWQCHRVCNAGQRTPRAHTERLAAPPPRTGTRLYEVRDLRTYDPYPRGAQRARGICAWGRRAGETGGDEDEDDDVAFSGDFDSWSSSEGGKSSHCGGHGTSDGWNTSDEEDEEEDEGGEEEEQAWKQLPASTLELVVEAEHRRCVNSGSALSAGTHGHGVVGGPAMRPQPGIIRCGRRTACRPRAHALSVCSS